GLYRQGVSRPEKGQPGAPDPYPRGGGRRVAHHCPLRARARAQGGRGRPQRRRRRAKVQVAGVRGQL
ncbi:hypothetical protein H4R19_002881, partial [Coemansia spiralis]